MEQTTDEEEVSKEYIAKNDGCVIYFAFFILIFVFSTTHLHPFDIFYSRTFCALFGTTSLFLYWAGHNLLRRKPKRAIVTDIIALGKAGMTYNAIYGYINWFVYLGYEKYMIPRDICLVIGTWVAGGLIIYYMVSKILIHNWKLKTTNDDM